MGRTCMSWNMISTYIQNSIHTVLSYILILKSHGLAMDTPVNHVFTEILVLQHQIKFYLWEKYMDRFETVLVESDAERKALEENLSPDNINTYNKIIELRNMAFLKLLNTGYKYDDYEDKIGIKVNGSEYYLTKDILQKYLNRSKKVQPKTKDYDEIKKKLEALEKRLDEKNLLPDFSSFKNTVQDKFVKTDERIGKHDEDIEALNSKSKKRDSELKLADKKITELKEENNKLRQTTEEQMKAMEEKYNKSMEDLNKRIETLAKGSNVYNKLTELKASKMLDEFKNELSEDFVFENEDVILSLSGVAKEVPDERPENTAAETVKPDVVQPKPAEPETAKPVEAESKPATEMPPTKPDNKPVKEQPKNKGVDYKPKPSRFEANKHDKPRSQEKKPVTAREEFVFDTVEPEKQPQKDISSEKGALKASNFKTEGYKEEEIDVTSHKYKDILLNKNEITKHYEMLKTDFLYATPMLGIQNMDTADTYTGYLGIFPINTKDFVVNYQGKCYLSKNGQTEIPFYDIRIKISIGPNSFSEDGFEPIIDLDSKYLAKYKPVIQIESRGTKLHVMHTDSNLIILPVGVRNNNKDFAPVMVVHDGVVSSYDDIFKIHDIAYKARWYGEGAEKRLTVDII